MNTVSPPDSRIVPISFPPNTQGLNSTTFHVPPLDGSISFPELHDWQYHNSPNHPVYIFSENSDANDIRLICWKELVPAIHRAGRVISSMFNLDLPVPAHKAPVIAVLALSDTFTYCTVNLGILRTGAVLFAVSPRNSAQAIAHLLRSTETNFLLIGPEQALQNVASEALEIIRQADGLVPKTGCLPVFNDLFPPSGQEKGVFQLLPPLHCVDLSRTGIIVHSSGSTAFPKPIYWSYYALILMGRFPFFGTQDFCGLRTSFHSIPMFHGLGVCAIVWSATCGMIITSFAPRLYANMPTPNTIFNDIVATKSEAIFVVPSFIEIWSQNPEKVERMKKLKSVYYGGGPLAKQVGDVLFAQGVQIIPLYASSETSLISKICKHADKDWEYFQISPHIKAHFIPDGTGAFELVTIVHADHHPAVLNTRVGNMPAYATNDLLVPHPTRKGFWRVYGRLDEQIIHSNGEKTNPVPLEAIMNRDPHVMSSVCFGRGRFSPGLLVDPQPGHKFDPQDAEKLTEFRNLIWPTVVKMNAFAPQHSRVFKEMILVSMPSKPFEYTGKGTARRGAIINAYDKEIQELYVSLENITDDGITPPPVWTPESALKYVRAVVHNIMTYPIHDDDDLFHWGCDSLQATWIRKIILHSLRRSAKINPRDVPCGFVYEHPTIIALARYVSDTVLLNAPVLQVKKVEEMLSMLRKYSSKFPARVSTSPPPRANTGDVVLITGTTGSIGSNLLLEFFGLPGVVRIYALNRRGTKPLRARQREALRSRGLDTTILHSNKVVLVEADLCKPNLGMSRKLLSEIRSTVTHILHTAWPVNFNLTLNHFEPNVQGLRNLIDLALSSHLPSPPRLLFTSTVLSVMYYPQPDPVPEGPLKAEYAVGAGYGESKWVAEMLLNTASSKTTLRPVVVRVGQVSGGVNGCWKPTEWFPSIIHSARFVKCLPSSEKAIAFIPLDTAAKIIVEMRNSPVQVLHLVHPSPVSWNTILRPMAESLRVPLVSHEEWFNRLESSGNTKDAEENHVLRLLGLFRIVSLDSPTVNVMGIPTLSMDEAMKISAHLRQVRRLADDVQKWLAYWKIP